MKKYISSSIKSLYTALTFCNSTVATGSLLRTTKAELNEVTAKADQEVEGGSYITE